MKKFQGVILAAALASMLSLPGFAAENQPASVDPAAQSDQAALPPLSDAQRAQLEEVIHSYLVTHPEVLVEAAQMMELRRQVEIRLKIEDTAAEIAANQQIPVRFGDENSVHHLVEFFDYNCGYCKASRPIVEEFASKHNVRVHYIEFPVLSELSVQASLIGMALFLEEPRKYFIYQDHLMGLEGKLEKVDVIKEAVAAAGGDWDALLEAAKDPKVQELVGANLEVGRSIGVTGVPFFIVDGKALRGAISSVDNFTELLK